MNYQKITKNLILKIKELKKENKSLIDIIDANEMGQERWEQRNTKLRKDKERAEQQLREQQDNNDYLNSQRNNLLDKLEKQDRYGDCCGAAKTRKELKNLY